jgi:O-antigen ligase
MGTKSTAENRLVLLGASMRMFADHPFVGVGFNTFGDVSHEYVRQVRSTIFGYREAWMGKGVKQHNQLLNVLTELGLMGFVPLCLMYYFLFRTLWAARRIHDRTFDRGFVVVVTAVFMSYATALLFMEPRFFEFMNVMPFFLAGIVVGGYQRATLKGWNSDRVERSNLSEGTIR